VATAGRDRSNAKRSGAETMTDDRKTSAPEQPRGRTTQPRSVPYKQRRPYDYLTAHPEHRPRALSPRLSRRRQIRGET
jgi:hypothetical protein